jgi:hypothetical protein
LQYYILYILFLNFKVMKNLSLKMDESVFAETEHILKKVRKNRNRYINEAVEFYNILQKRKILSKELKRESRLVQEESMKVLDEFESLENDD